jgi:hypothetical protein
MALLRPGLVGTTRRLASVVAAATLLTACSNATPSPAVATTAPSAAAAADASTAPSLAPSLAPSAVATPVPSAGPTPLRVAQDVSCAPRSAAEDHCVPAGRYTLDEPLAGETLTIDVPSGWFEWDLGGGSEGLLVAGGADAPGGSGWGILFAPIGQVPRDPCDANKGYLPASATVDDVVGAMAKWPGFKALGTPGSITIDGYSGKLIGLAYTKKAGTCPSSALWLTPSGAEMDSYPMIDDPSRPAQFRILDVGGKLLGIRTTDYPEPSPFELEQGVARDPHRHVQDQTALRSIVESIQIVP